jgi:hypothetical protein
MVPIPARPHNAYRRGVDRRWWGVIVVAAVLVAAFVVPNLPARRVAGVPIGLEVAGPPASGDCVTTMDDPWAHFADPAPQIDEVFDFPTAAFGSCSGPVVGEVVSVSSSADPAPRITATDYLSQFSPCAIDAITYTGSIPPVVAGQAGRPSIIWAPQIRFQYTTVGPDRVQRAAGQHWSACVIGSMDDVPFTGRLKNVLTDGTLPPEFGSCLSSADAASAREVPCDQPHATEILGSSSTGPVPIDAADAQQACEVFAGRALRTADPTRGGAIQILTLTYGEQGQTIVQSDAGPLGNTYLECRAVASGGAMFNRSLIGVADGPLPVS